MPTEPKITGTPDEDSTKNLSKGRRQKHEFHERCPDCELNEYLDNVGNPIKGSRVTACSNCVRGRINLYTVDHIRRSSEPEKILGLLFEGRARLVKASELADPYLVKKKG